MIRFFNNDIFTEPGDPIKKTFEPIVLDDGTIDLVESGKIDLQAEIDSYREECDLNVIIQRYANGETDVLNKRKGMYGDFTQMPKTYAEVLQLQIDSRNLFNSLPVDIKEKFDNDENKFFVQAGTQEWFDIIEPLYKIKDVKEEVKSDES